MNNNTSFYENMESEEAEKNVKRIILEKFRNGLNSSPGIQAIPCSQKHIPDILVELDALLDKYASLCKESVNIQNKSKSTKQNPDCRDTPNRAIGGTKWRHNAFTPYIPKFNFGFPIRTRPSLFIQKMMNSTIEPRSSVDVAEQSTLTDVMQEKHHQKVVTDAEGTLNDTEAKEKSALPSNEVIRQEEGHQKFVQGSENFDISNLKHSETQEKNPLLTNEAVAMKKSAA